MNTGAFHYQYAIALEFVLLDRPVGFDELDVEPSDETRPRLSQARRRGGHGD
ncbi:MAG TPA: hypothetical protein VN458_07160 [Solirubrobacterales bacterium]|nr:hypothetical protein [Solirubrobacterales bacterium]